MKKLIPLMFLASLLMYNCSTEGVVIKNDQEISAKFLEIITNSEIQTAIASKSYSSKAVMQKGAIASDAAFVIQTEDGLVFVQFSGDKVFAFLGVDPIERVKEKNGEVQFDTRAKKVYCAVAGPTLNSEGKWEIIYSNLCPKPSFKNATGTLVAKGRLMPSDKIKDVDEVGALYGVNGAGIVNAKDIGVDDTFVDYISVKEQEDLALKARLICSDEEFAPIKYVSLKSETDINGVNIELNYSIE